MSSILMFFNCSSQIPLSFLLHVFIRFSDTGTPVQNRVHELWAAFDFLMPNFLGTQSAFSKDFAKPILDGQLPGVPPEKIGIGMEKLRLLHQQVLPFILRREKRQVLKDLPPKIITDIPCALSKEQEDLYRKFCSGPDAFRGLEELKRSARSRGGERKDRESRGQDALKSLLYLRLLCTHPSLVVKRKQGIDGDDMRGVTSSSDFCGVRGSGMDYTRLDCSGKLQTLDGLLRSSSIYHENMTGADNDESLIYVDDSDERNDDELLLSTDGADSEFCDTAVEDDSEEDHKSSKCLIFAQFNQSLDAVEKFLFKPHMPSLRYLRLDGRVPPENRVKVVDCFNNDESIKVLLLTTKVGGLGLNLTGEKKMFS